MDGWEYCGNTVEDAAVVGGERENAEGRSLAEAVVLHFWGWGLSSELPVRTNGKDLVCGQIYVKNFTNIQSAWSTLLGFLNKEFGGGWEQEDGAVGDDGSFYTVFYREDAYAEVEDVFGYAMLVYANLDWVN